MADPSSGRLVTALALDRRVRVLVAVIDGPAREMCRRHALQGGAAVAASEGLVSATLLSSQLKGREQLSLNIHGEQPEFRFVADVRGGIAVRARLDCPRALPDAGLRFDGLVAMHKFLEDKELYRGMAEVADGTLVEALQGVLDRSIQVDGLVRLRARLDEDGVLEAASGILVERLPDMADEDFVSLVQQPLQEDIDTVLTQFAFGQLAGAPVEVLDSQRVDFSCHCSAERVHSMLRAVGREELQAMLDEDGRAEITCHFCNEHYLLDADALRALIDDL